MTKKDVRKRKNEATSEKTGNLTELEGRQGNRVPIQLLVDYRSEGNYLFDFCRDLGTGGIFIQTESPLPQGSKISLTFTIPDSKETVQAAGEVIWVQNPNAAKREASTGMGIQFREFSTDQRKVLEDFVRRYHGNRFAEATVDSKSA